MFNAGTATAYGLSKEQALQLITGNAAQICGDEKRIGTIETGKVASLLICNGDLLDMRTNMIEQAFIDGVAVELNGEQQALYRKFMKKYGLQAE
jgi:imidazolonepropionase-like amidohydrolase